MRFGPLTKRQMSAVALLIAQMAAIVWALQRPSDAPQTLPIRTIAVQPSLQAQLALGEWLDWLVEQSAPFHAPMDWKLLNPREDKPGRDVWRQGLFSWRFEQESEWFVFWKNLIAQESKRGHWQVEKCFFKPWQSQGLQAECLFKFYVKESP